MDNINIDETKTVETIAPKNKTKKFQLSKIQLAITCVILAIIYISSILTTYYARGALNSKYEPQNSQAKFLNSNNTPNLSFKCKDFFKKLYSLKVIQFSNNF